MPHWKDFFKRNSGASKRGGNSAENVGGNKHGRSDNAAKKLKKKGGGNKSK